MPKRGEPGGEYQPPSEVGQASPDLSISDIRGAAEELKRKVTAARQAKEQDIERRVSEHDQLGAQILSLRELLEAAQSTKDYFNTVKQAGELPPESEDQLKEIGTTIAGLEAQIAEAERRINLFGTQSEILDRIHEAAVSMRDSEIKEATMKKGIEDLTRKNDTLAAEMNALAQELREAWEEYQRVTSGFEESSRVIGGLMKRATDGLDYDKHGQTLEFLRSHGVPTIQQVEQRREKLGMLKGKEKAAMDVVLNHSDELRLYHELRDRQELLHDKIWRELRGKKREQLKQRITEHIIQAWELHERTGIKPEHYVLHAPQVVFEDLKAKVEALGGVKLVERQGRMKEEVENDNPKKKAIRDLWDGLDSGPDSLLHATYSKPKISSPE